MIDYINLRIASLVTPVVPALRKNYFVHESVRENNSGIITPSSAEVNQTTPGYCRILEGKPTCQRRIAALLSSQGCHFLGNGIQMAILHIIFYVPN
jgi:hypothetical protein